MATRFLAHSRLGTFLMMTAVLSVLLAGIVALRLSPGSGSEGQTSAEVLGEQVFAAQTDKTKDDKSSSKFSAAGSLEGLYPGATKPLSLTLSNDTGATIKVTSLSVAVANASAGCPAANLQVGAFNGPVTVPKKGTAPTIIQITMSPEAPSACQGVTFPLTYSGDASPA